MSPFHVCSPILLQLSSLIFLPYILPKATGQLSCPLGSEAVMMAEFSLFLHLFILSVLVYYNCYFRHEIRKDKFGSRFPEDYSTSLNLLCVPL